MKAKILLTLIFFLASNLYSIYAFNGPKCTQDQSWQPVVNSAYGIADDYAYIQNPRSSFLSMKQDYKFIKQVDGKYKGEYLLIIINKHGKNISFGVLLPLFDVNKSLRNLDNTKPLWKLVTAKFNGRPY